MSTGRRAGMGVLSSYPPRAPGQAAVCGNRPCCPGPTPIPFLFTLSNLIPKETKHASASQH